MISTSKKIRGSLLSFAELLVVLVASVHPLGSESIRDRTVRLLRGVNQRAVLETAHDGEVEFAHASAVVQNDSSGATVATNVDGPDFEAAAIPAGALPQFAWGPPTILASGAATDFPSSRSRSPEHIRGPPRA